MLDYIPPLLPDLVLNLFGGVLAHFSDIFFSVCVIDEPLGNISQEARQRRKHARCVTVDGLQTMRAGSSLSSKLGLFVPKTRLRGSAVFPVHQRRS